MSFHYTVQYPAPPLKVLGILTDPAFLKEYAVEMGTTSHEADVQEENGVWAIDLHLVSPTDQVPSIFKKFVGSEIETDDRREWVADGEGGYRSKLQVDANIKGRPATIRGSLTLRPSGVGTEFVAHGDASFNVPFIGGLIRDAICELCEACFEDEPKCCTFGSKGPASYRHEFLSPGHPTEHSASR